MDQVGGAKFTEPPLLVVEIRSPSTALIDLKQEKSRVREVRRALEDLDRESGPATAGTDRFELRDGRYALAAKASGPFTADRPFTVTIAPGRLTAGLRC